MAAYSTEIAREIALFSGCGPRRTWSVIATIMGDVLRDPASGISGRHLAALTGRMGISEQAQRVAIHRLKKDGWIESRRDGREAQHFLSADARRETEAVRPLIYDSQPKPIGAIWLVLAPPGSAPPMAEMLAGDAVQLSSRSALVASPGDVVDPRLLRAPYNGQEQPDWVGDALVPQDLRAELSHLTQQIGLALDQKLSTDLQRLVLRLVILHHWRRLVLRLSPLAEALLPQDWEGAQARRQVARALAHLPGVQGAELVDLLK